MSFLRKVYRFIMMTLILILLLSPFIIGFFLKLLASGFYAGMEQADEFLRKY